MSEPGQIRKARGAYFTPPALADYVTDWAVRRASDAVLEPSCGEAAFLTSIARRLCSLGYTPASEGHVQGVEIHAPSARRAAESMRPYGIAHAIHVGDFFDFESAPIFDAAVGNPPYVRYQQFAGEARARAQRVALAQGVQLQGLASSWAAFVVHAASLLKSDGRLGLVLPAELLTVNYAAPVRCYLMRRFGSVRLVLFEARVFPEVLEEVVLLLAEGQGPTNHCNVFQASDLADLLAPNATIWTPADTADKWVAGLIPRDAARAYQSLADGETFAPLQVWGETDLGMVTGNNRYFTMPAHEARALDLKTSELLPISPPSSRHLRGLDFTKHAWDQLSAEGGRTYLFYPGKDPSDAALRYIRQGEAGGVHQAYKCRVRSPWWRVPLVSVPDLFLTYMNLDTPRLVANGAGARYLNSIHGLFVRPEFRELAVELLPLAALNSVTLLSAELVGRSYGGGILKIEPKEADRLLVPSPLLLAETADELRALRPQLAQQLRHGDLIQAVRRVDRVLLTGALHLSLERIEHLRDARAWLFSRRVARANGHR